MKLQRVKYSKLNSKQKEIYNFQKIASKLADYGFNCIKLDDDWQGADFLAYHKDAEKTLRVQLKSRIMISKKYRNKNLHIAFPANQNWYLIEHDKLVKLVGKHTNWLKTASWFIRGRYSSRKPNRLFLVELEKSKL